jgi:hypothetical protein
MEAFWPVVNQLIRDAKQVFPGRSQIQSIEEFSSAPSVSGVFGVSDIIVNVAEESRGLREPDECFAQVASMDPTRSIFRFAEGGGV